LLPHGLVTIYMNEQLDIKKRYAVLNIQLTKYYK
jgi:hypothetical protein